VTESGRRGLLVIVPTFNEGATLPALLESLRLESRSVNGPALEVLVVDDASPDGSAGIVREARGRWSGRLHLLERPRRLGLGSAYRDGFQWGLARGYRLLVQMDADHSHDPRELAALTRLAESHDLVVGSRYVPGARIQGWGPFRRVLSAAASAYTGLVLTRQIRDFTSGYCVWRADALATVGFSDLSCRGYGFQIELKYRAWARGLSVAEAPIAFAERLAGRSKLPRRLILEAAVAVLRLRLTIPVRRAGGRRYRTR
jgi:dolichol-phosphate mannosyltransferase